MHEKPICCYIRSLFQFRFIDIRFLIRRDKQAGIDFKSDKKHNGIVIKPEEENKNNTEDTIYLIITCKMIDKEIEAKGDHNKKETGKNATGAEKPKFDFMRRAQSIHY